MVYGFNALLFVLLAGGFSPAVGDCPGASFPGVRLFAAGFLPLCRRGWRPYHPFRNLLGEWLDRWRWHGLGLALATVFDAPKQAVRVILVLCITSRGRLISAVNFCARTSPGILGALAWGAAYGMAWAQVWDNASTRARNRASTN